MAIRKQTSESNNLKKQYSIEFHLVLVSALPQSHSLREFRVLLLG